MQHFLQTLLVLLKCIYPPACWQCIQQVYIYTVTTTFPHHYACITIAVVQWMYSCSCHVLIDKPLFLLSKIDTVIIVPLKWGQIFWGSQFCTPATKSVISTDTIIVACLIFTCPFIIHELKNNINNKGQTTQCMNNYNYNHTQHFADLSASVFFSVQLSRFIMHHGWMDSSNSFFYCSQG